MQFAGRGSSRVCYMFDKMNNCHGGMQRKEIMWTGPERAKRVVCKGRRLCGQGLKGRKGWYAKEGRHMDSS